jgi:hypothetical protein
MGGNELRDAETSALYVKNGINPAMSYTQVHYLKGYFLLRYQKLLHGLQTLKHQRAAALFFLFLGQQLQKKTMKKVCTLLFQSLPFIQYCTARQDLTCEHCTNMYQKALPRLEVLPRTNCKLTDAIYFAVVLSPFIPS